MNDNNNPELLTPTIPTPDNNQGLLTPTIPEQKNDLNNTSNTQESVTPNIQPQNSNQELLTPNLPIQDSNLNNTNNIQTDITPSVPQPDNNNNINPQPTITPTKEESSPEPNNLNNLTTPIEIDTKPTPSSNTSGKKKKLIIGAGVIAFVIIAFVVGRNLFSSSGETKDGTTINEEEVLSVKNSISNYDLKINSVEKNISIKAVMATETTNFTKLNITITNKNDTDLYIGGVGFNFFSLNDDLDKKIGTCSALATVGYEISDSIVDTVEAKKTATGNLYCNMTSTENPSKFVIKTITSIDKNAYKNTGTVKSTGSSTFYIKLNS